MRDALNLLLVYLPISMIGLWRWSMWLTKILVGRLYRPLKSPWPSHKRKPKISVVVPVYNEDREILHAALDSWIENKVDEIIAVIDYTNVRHIVEFDQIYANRKDVKCKMIVTRKPGKRAALADGIERSNGDIIVLADSDTIWSKDVIRKVLPYFMDPLIGGVTAQQRILKPKTTAQVLFDILLWTRYHEELPFMLGAGRVVNTLSGRTAFYRREALLNKAHDNVHQLTHEFFLRTRAVSGDDKRLTHLLLEQGWHTGFARDAVVYTPGEKRMKTFLKQRLRWTRNSWRADTRAFAKGWIFGHPALAIYNFDRFVQPFIMLIGPIALAVFVVNQNWLFAGVLLAWWAVSRFIRIFGYFARHPTRLLYLPAYIIFTYVNAGMKIYAWATILEQGWITRWHKARLKTKRALRRTGTVGVGLGATATVCFVLFQVVQNVHTNLGLNVAAAEDVETVTITPRPAPPIEAPTLADLFDPTAVEVYEVKPGDTLFGVSQAVGVDAKELKKVNGIEDADEIYPGDVIRYVRPQ